MFSILKLLVFLPKYTILSGFTESWGMTLDIIHVVVEQRLLVMGWVMCGEACIGAV